MVATDRQITEWITLDRDFCSPEPQDHQIQPASLDLRLGNEFFLPSSGRRELGVIGNPMDGERITLEDHQILTVYPGQFLLATTLERLSIPPKVVAFLHGKSSLAREGLLIHVTAGLLDPGWSGYVTLEIVNMSPSYLILRPGIMIAQVTYHLLSETPLRTYGHPELGSHYQNQGKAVPPA